MVGYLWPKVKDWNWETIFTDIHLGQSSTTVTYLASIETEIGEKTQKNSYYAVQGRARSSMSISIESPYVTSY